uniref:Uncharacterized protein n=1 Tax=Romanomermis culicivorax TaxID=13658 RepID=A0A915KQ59_ROMCU
MSNTHRERKKKEIRTEKNIRSAELLYENRIQVTATLFINLRVQNNIQIISQDDFHFVAFKRI